MKLIIEIGVNPYERSKADHPYCGDCKYLDFDGGAVSCDLFNEILTASDENHIERDGLCLESGAKEAV